MAAALWRCGSVTTTTVAGRITQERDLLVGPHAVGGMGDWYLANDKIQLVIDDVGNQNGVAPSGGTVVDFVRRDAPDDVLNQIYQVFMLSPGLPLIYDSIAAETTDASATIRVKGHVYVTGSDGTTLTQAVADTLHAETAYTLLPGDATVHVTTSLTNTGKTTVSGLATLSDIFVWGNRGLNPFEPYRGRGFTHLGLNIANPIGALGSYLYVGARAEADPRISYGTVAPSLPNGLITGVNTEQFSALGQSPFYAKPFGPGATLTYARRYLVGAERTIESIAEQALRILNKEAPAVVPSFGHLAGRLVGLPPGREAEVTAQLPADELGAKPINSTTVNSDGGFFLTLPPGTYQLRISIGALPTQTVGPFVVTAGTITPLADLAAPSFATLTFTVRCDSATLPIRLTLHGVGGTPEPKLGPTYSGIVCNNIAYSLDGTGTIAVEPGTYDVYASRGLEYTLAHQTVTLTAGVTTPVAFDLFHVVTTPGYLSGDFHVHSSASLDSSLDAISRVIAFAGEAVEVLVATDHDYLTDLGPTVHSLGLDAQIATMVGVETTGFVPVPNTLPNTIGHNGSWPLTVSPTAPRHGAPPDEYIEPAVLYERLRKLASGTPVVQLNHPRDGFLSNVGMGYFANFKFNPRLPIPSTDDGGTNSFLRRTSLDGHDNTSFDAMEVINGVGLASTFQAQQNRDDWLALLKQGIVRTGMANSDSHASAFGPVGFPRTYVRYAAAGPSDFDAEAFDGALLKHQAVGTNGPYIALRTGDGLGPGDQVTLPGAGAITFSIEVQAAPWIPVDEVRVLVNGEVVCAIGHAGVTGSAAAGCPASLAANPSDPYGQTGVLRYADTVQLSVQADAFVTVEAGALLPAAADLDGDGVLDTWDCNGDGAVDQADTVACMMLRDASTYPLPGLPTSSPLSSPPVVNAIVPGMVPCGFTNPIFVHLATTGPTWAPPGLH